MNQLQRLAVRSVAVPPRASPLSLASRPSPWSPWSTPSSTSAASVRAASTTADGENASHSAPAPPLVLPYKAKKVWPPDFTLLSRQEQLRFEKRYKRRVSLRSERPRWTKFVKLAQLVCITAVVIYGVLFMEWDYSPQPFDGVRAWFWETLGSMTGRQSAARKAVDNGEQRDATR